MLHEIIVVEQGESRDARVQECKSEGTQECVKVREEGIEKFRDARFKKLKSACMESRAKKLKKNA
jgi:hypothetical protein